MQPINHRDVHIAVMFDGQDAPALFRRRNPQQVAWERYAHKHGYDLKHTAILGLTYQAWWAARPGVGFDEWAETVDEVYPAAPDGTRLEVDKKTGRLVMPGGDEVEDETPDPTRPAGSAT